MRRLKLTLSGPGGFDALKGPRLEAVSNELVLVERRRPLQSAAASSETTLARSLLTVRDAVDGTPPASKFANLQLLLCSVESPLMATSRRGRGRWKPSQAHLNYTP
jgi:hypothetical protein